MIDANHAYSYDEALQLSKKLETLILSGLKNHFPLNFMISILILKQNHQFLLQQVSVNT